MNSFLAKCCIMAAMGYNFEFVSKLFEASSGQANLCWLVGIVFGYYIRNQ